MNDRLFRTVIGAVLSLVAVSLALAATSTADLDSLRDKAENGNAIAQYNLGLIYADADEPAHDLIQAYVWLSRAAQNGARGRQLEIVAERLNNAQLAEARRILGQPAVTPAAAPFTTVPLEGDAEVTRLREERAQLLTQLNQARASLEQLRRAGTGNTAELQKRVSIAETALANREVQIATLNAEITQLRSSGPSEREVALQNERDRLVTEATAAATELATLRAQSARNRDLVQQLESQSAAAREATVAFNRTQGELNAERARIASLTNQLTEQNNEADRLRTQVAELSDELTARAATSVDATQANDRIQDLLTQLASANLRIEELSGEVAALRKEARPAKDQVSALGLELYALRGQNATVRQPPEPASRATTTVATNNLSSAPSISVPPVSFQSTGRARPTRPAEAPATISFPPPTRTGNVVASLTISDGASTHSATPVNSTSGPRRHTIMPGESLSRIAQKYYGNGNLWPRILAANREAIPDPNILHVGTPIVIP